VKKRNDIRFGIRGDRKIRQSRLSKTGEKVLESLSLRVPVTAGGRKLLAWTPKAKRRAETRAKDSKEGFQKSRNKERERNTVSGRMVKVTFAKPKGKGKIHYHRAPHRRST